jgi:hypothetical protein
MCCFETRHDVESTSRCKCDFVSRVWNGNGALSPAQRRGLAQRHSEMDFNAGLDIWKTLFDLLAENVSFEYTRFLELSVQSKHGRDCSHPNSLDKNGLLNY